MTFQIAIVTIACACLAALIVTPIAARLASRLGMVDRPDGNRKSQALAIPLGGGVAVAVATAVTLVGVVLRAAPEGVTLQPVPLLHGLLPAALVLLAVGIVDDGLGLTGIYKLIGQMLAASLLVAGGFRFDSVSFLNYQFAFGDFGIPFTLFFVLGAINAFNLIDGADGLAASVGAIVCLTLGVIAGAQGGFAASALCLAMAGALIGFLRYNAPPARIYLGDAGSMLIGLIVAAVAVHCSIKQQAAFALAVPIAICAIPILDVAAALVRRVTTGQSVFAGDRGHLHHALLHRGWSARKTAAFVAALDGHYLQRALASYYTRNEAYALLSAGGVFAALAAARIFGHAEIHLIAAHAASAIRAAYFRQARRPRANVEQTVQLQGKRRWEMIWAALREAAPTHNLSVLKLTVNIPRLHESFYATWKRNDDESVEDCWRLTLPLTLEGRLIGKLLVAGASSGRTALSQMQQLMEYLEPLEDQLRQLAEDVAEPDAAGLTATLPAAIGLIPAPAAIGIADGSQNAVPAHR